ncbi:MAG: DUF2891 domain-containing protein [Planctomyces sp.]|nr:DUF2891 domain-containing protein [Planctomyces sp.]
MPHDSDHHDHRDLQKMADPREAIPWEPLLSVMAGWAMGGIVREYPAVLPQVLYEPSHVSSPRELWPVFYGCFDWHSAVHSHGALARFVRVAPEHPEARAWVECLTRSLTSEGLAGEYAYFIQAKHATFERAYGWVWYFDLCRELHRHPQAELRACAIHLQPLELLLRDRFLNWIQALQRPIRTGEHNQTAFSLGFALDYARARGDLELERAIVEKSLTWHLTDERNPLAFEPSAHDFLSPSLGVADLLSRCIETPEAFADWLARAFPEWHAHPGSARQWPTVGSSDRVDGKAAHLDGLAFSRAWMLERIARRLPGEHPLRCELLDASRIQGASGLAALESDSYMTSHWVGSFAAKWLTHAIDRELDGLVAGEA